MTTKKSVVRRLAAGVGALALATAGTLAMGTAASAATDNVGPDQPGAPTTGTLTINKYSGGHTTQPDPENLLDGVEFTVTQVGRTVDGVCTPVDLADADDWDGLEGLFDSAPAAPGAPFCLLTGDDYVHIGQTVAGQVVFPLDVGVYFVSETDPGNNPIVSVVPDFYVSIPTSLGEDGDGWTYDVVADPKNQLSEAPSKTVKDRPSGLILGSTVTWEMEVPIPILNNNEPFTKAVITDVLDSRLTLVDDSSVVRISGSPDVALTEGTHYGVTVTGNTVTWTLTAAGRLLLDANMGQNLLIDFDTVVNSVGDGSIPNDDYESDFNGTKVPGEDTPYTYWGQLKILKVDDSNPALPLEGAEFQVFEKTETTCPATAPNTGAVATGTSNADGVVVWAANSPLAGPQGLWIANSNTPLTNPTKDYCVYETVVPAGHTAVAIGNPVTITPGETNVFDLTVKNAKKDGPDLPLTGAQGTMIMTLGGLLLVGAGTGAIVVSRRNRNHVEA